MVAARHLTGATNQVALALSVCASAACSNQSGATAQRIASRDLLIGGPKATADIGDYLLSNGKVRAIVHDVGDGRASLPYGGTLIDADLVRPGGEGLDQLGELTPALFASIMQPETIEVASDGKDGGAAELIVRGRARDLVEQTGLLMAGLLFPEPLAFSQAYSLGPDDSFITIRTEIVNTGTGVHPLPFLSPDQLVTSGLDIPNLPELELSIPMGHLLGVGGTQQSFFEGTGFDTFYGVVDAYRTANGFPAFPGVVAGFVAAAGPDVSYGLSAPAAASNYPSAFASLYAPQEVTDASLLVGFNFSGYLGIYHANPPKQLGPGESFSYTTYLHIGRGDVASISDQIYAEHDTPTATWSGVVLERTSSAPRSPSLVVTKNNRVITQVRPNERGAFSMQLPPDTYTIEIIDPLLPRHQLPITVGASGASTRIEVDSPAELALSVRDENGRLTPAKATLVAEFDAANVGNDPRTFLFSLGLGEGRRSTALDPTRRDYVEAVHVTRGTSNWSVRPGRYRLIISKGPEYQVVERTLDLAPGALAQVDVAPERAFFTPGWVAADLHMHSVFSVDGGISARDRVVAAAAEGLDIAVATEHNRVVSYAPAIWEMELVDHLSAIDGMELTTFEMGHFNAYPLRQDPATTRGHDVKWLGQRPDDIFTSLRELGTDPSHTIVQVNHPRSGLLGYFTQYNVNPDTAVAQPRSGIAGVFAPYSDEFAPEAYSTAFDALELLTGKGQNYVRTGRAPNPLPPTTFPDPQPVPGEVIRDSNGDAVFPGTVETWFTMLNQGLRVTGVGSSDSHSLSDEPGYSRTWIWVGADNDAPVTTSTELVVDALRSQRAFTSNGPFVDIRVDDARMGDDVHVSGNATLAIDVRWASWQAPNTVRVWGNGDVLAEFAIDGSTGVYVNQVPLNLARDTWVVVEVTGDTNLFPIVTPLEDVGFTVTDLLPALGSTFDLTALSPYAAIEPPRLRQVTPYAITNPIWIDVDGNGFGTKLAPRRAAALVPSVRAQFERIVEASGQGVR